MLLVTLLSGIHYSPISQRHNYTGQLMACARLERMFYPPGQYPDLKVGWIWKLLLYFKQRENLSIVISGIGACSQHQQSSEQGSEL